MPKQSKLRIKELLAIKERREERRITTRMISEELRVSRGTVIGHLNNTIKRIDLPTLDKWRDYLGVDSVRELFVEDDLVRA